MSSQNKILILGAGESGVGAALLAKNRGYDVFISDSNEIALNFKEELTVGEIEFEETSGLVASKIINSVMNFKHI